ncbi:MAG: hypothetical protein JRI25_27210 [Deltaproteobacteria bacterium]|nr:hypothetical protein [Deltaproteobacteria bacterium]
MTADALGGHLNPVAQSRPPVPISTPEAPAARISPRALAEATLAAVAAKTGYPADMLELSMDMESDLGIDSIKRVEILAAVQEAVPGLPELDNDQLSALRTLADVVDHLETRLGIPSSSDALAAATLAAVAAKTGYPADMLELSMDMESDLGIDSIKRVEILAAVQEACAPWPTWSVTWVLWWDRHPRRRSSPQQSNRRRWSPSPVRSPAGW